MSEITKLEFLKSKAANFRTLLNSYSPDSDAVKLMSGFNELLLVPTIQNYLVPLKKSGKLDEISRQVMDHLTVPESDKEAVRSKIVRYFQCFCETVS